MCGITGLIDPRMPSPEIRRTLQSMTDAIKHRGPDDEGFFVADGVGLGMRRLSIIDVAGGRQPIATEDGLIQVIFNGEIYNHLELRSDLERCGHVFRTRSDTEVIAHLYEEKGVDCLTYLRGMFGIAIWDQRARRLVLARDRLGKKPLFYAQQNGRLLFGSEIKGILAAESRLAETDLQAMMSYFQCGFVPEPRTMFRQIWKLPAAHYAIYENGKIIITPYWRLRFGESGESRRALNQWVEELDALLEESVRIRLMSEVPLGVFLSGGLDSSTITAYAKRAGLRPLRTFTIGFDRKEWDESRDAKVVAEHLKTDHHVLTLREQDLLASLPETVHSLVRHFDEPFGDASSLPTFHVSKLAREYVTVILSGDGGDELFAGYTGYQGIKFAEQYRRLPSWLGKQILPRCAENVAKWLPAGRRYSALRAAKVLRDSSLPFESMYFTKSRMCSDDLLSQVLSGDVRRCFARNGLPEFADDIAMVMQSNLPVLSKASYADLRIGLLDDMLVKVDRMSMAHSLEVRSPFLDHRLVEFAAGIPPSLKLRGWQTKAILRDTVKAYLPRSTLRKRKQGFSVPLREWFKGGLYEMVGDYLEVGNGRLPRDVFNHSRIGKLLGEHRKGEGDYSSIIWLLLNYAAWHGLYIRQGAF